MLFHSCTSASRSSCSVSVGFWRWRIRLPSSSHKCSIGDRPGDKGRTRMWFWFRKSWQTRATWHLALLFWKMWSKFCCCSKGRTIRIKNIVSVFYGFQCSLNNLELSTTIMTNSSPDHNTSASKTVGLIHTLVRKTFPTPAVHTITSIANTKWKSGFITKDVLLGVKPPTTVCTSPSLSRGPMALFKGWSYERSPDWRSLLRTVWPEIRTFARPGVLRAVSSAVIIRFRRWIRRKFLSWRCDVTRGLPLRGLSFVLPVCRRRIISLEIVILDTLQWSATTWWVIPAWTIPNACSRSF